MALTDRARHAHVDLYSQTVAVAPDGRRQLVATGASPRWALATRVIVPADATATQRGQAMRRAERQVDWLHAGTVPGTGTRYEAMARTAMLDLHTLTLDDGAVVAGWSGPWRYVWPRDAAFVAVAMNRTGHQQDAADVLAFLQRVQAPDGSFQARYLPDGSGPPDDRGVQEDGPGWALWAAADVLDGQRDAAARAELRRRLDPLIERCTQRLLRRTATDGLPAPSSDYWEVDEDELTLGTAATALAGLDAARRILGTDLQRGPRTPRRAAELASVTTAHAGVLRAVEEDFGAQGYPRHRGGGSLDAAVTFLLPPYQSEVPRGALAAERAAPATMLRPAGGLAPGEGWKDDGISWTPETALFALAAAHTGDRAQALRWLDWLSEHRTREGSLPEKVLADGSPAAVAPLSWTAALVVLTLDRLGPP